VALFLLDTNVIIDHVKRRRHAMEAVRQIVGAGDDLCLSDVVFTEIITGLFPTAEPRTRGLLNVAIFLPMSAAAAEVAGKWRFDFARRGVTLSLADAMIAAVGHQHHATIVTANVRHFPMDGISLMPLTPAS
jgi:predicted nucleic acid-binding protein